MAQTKLQQQIEAAAKRIQDEQKRLKQLQNQQAEKDRKARNHRLCKRHGFIESILPDTINLTDEQFETFVKQHIANKHGMAALANLTGQEVQTNADTAPADTKPQNGGAPAPSVTRQNNGNHAPKHTAQNNGKPANPQAATA